jgi:cell division protein FtsL
MAIEVHLEKRIVNHNVIREADARSHRDYVVVTVIAAMFLVGLFVYAWQHYQWIQYGYRIEEAQKKREQLAEIGRQLLLERALLCSPQRIDAIARRDLGMVVPVPGQLITLNADAPLAMPSPQPAQAALQTEVQAQPASLAAKR